MGEGRGEKGEGEKEEVRERKEGREDKKREGRSGKERRVWGKRGWERKLVLVGVSIVKHHNQKLLREEKIYFSLYFQ